MKDWVQNQDARLIKSDANLLVVKRGRGYTPLASPPSSPTLTNSGRKPKKLTMVYLKGDGVQVWKDLPILLCVLLQCTGRPGFDSRSGQVPGLQARSPDLVWEVTN